MTRREHNKQETIRAIRGVFLKQLKEEGVERITVAGLANDCGIAKSTFYLYFDDKYAVLESIEVELLDSLREITHDLSDCDLNEVRVGKPLEEALETVRFLRENADTFRALLGARGDARFAYRWRKDIEASFLHRFRAEQGSARSADIACTIFSSALVGLYTHLLFDLPDVTDREFAIIMGNLLHYSLFDFHAFAEQPRGL